MSASDWRWWLRRDCRNVAASEHYEDSLGHGIRIAFCRRWRWHRGPCRGVLR